MRVFVASSEEVLRPVLVLILSFKCDDFQISVDLVLFFLTVNVLLIPVATNI